MVAGLHELAVPGLTEEHLLRDLLEQTTPVLRRVERMHFGSFAARESVAQDAEIIRLARLGDAEAAARACRENWLSLRFTSAE